MITKTQLKQEYGFSDGWIKRLGEPDKLVKMSGRKHPAMLYEQPRVEAFISEHKSEFDIHLEKRAKRSDRSRRIADLKRQELIKEAMSVRIECQPLPKKLKVYDREIVEFYIGERGVFDPHIGESARLAHYRHEYTNYHSELKQIFGKVGVGEAYEIIHERINELAEIHLKESYGESWRKD